MREFLPDRDSDSANSGLAAWDRSYADALNVDLAAKCRSTTGASA